MKERIFIFAFKTLREGYSYFIWGYINFVLHILIFYSDRPLGVGLATAGHYVIGFPFSKTFYNLRETIHLSGCFILYGVLGFIGFSYLYLCLPETEGKSLAEIEKHFSKKSKKNNQNTVTWNWEFQVSKQIWRVFFFFLRFKTIL